MSKKHFSWLLGVTVVVAVLAFLVPRDTVRDESVEQGPLLPDLQGLVNDINWLRISAEGKTVATLRREGGQWVVAEAHAYRADWPKVQQLLSDLAGARIVEPKTVNPDYYDRLGVEDPSSPDAAGSLVEFHESTGLPAVIVGNSAQGRDGRYVRLAGSEQSLLVDREPELSRAAEDWLDGDIVDIAESEVVEVAVSHEDGETVLARKVSADDENFELQGVPEGSEPKSAWTINSLADGLSSLTLDAVVPAGEIDWSGATGFRLLTADGLNVEASLVVVSGAEGEPDSHWIKLEAGLYTTTLDAGVEPETAGETESRAAEINDRVAGWAYRIPQYKYSAMTKRMDDLVQKADPDA